MKKIVYSLLLRVSRLPLFGFLIRVLAKIAPNHTPVTLLILGSISYRNNRKPHTSLSLLRKAIGQADDNPRYIKELAETYYSLNEYQRASKLYQQALSLYGPKTSPKIYYKLIKTLRLSAKYDAAGLISSLASHYFPDDIDIRREKIRLLKHDGDHAGIKSMLSNSPFVELEEEHQRLYLQSLIETSDLESLSAVMQSLDIYSKPYCLLAYATLLTEQHNWKDAKKAWDFIYENKDNPTYRFKLSEQRTAQFNSEIIAKILDPEKYLTYASRKKSKKKAPKVAVVTSYTKGYDTLKPHSNIHPDYDYLVFTDDNSAETYGFYKLKPLPIDEPDGRISTRYAKMQPHKFLKDYDVVVWIDASIMLIDDIEPQIDSFVSSNKPFGTSPHTHRNTALEELIICADIGKDSVENLQKQFDAMNDADLGGVPLYENGMLMFNMNQISSAEKAIDEWWDHVNNYSKRDQLSLGYVMQKHNVDVHEIIKRPGNINNNPALLLMPHKIRFTALDALEELVSRS